MAPENDIKVDIDPKTGETHVVRYLHVVELVENDKTEISLKTRAAAIPTPRSAISSPRPCRWWISNRINAQNAKQVIVQKVATCRTRAPI